MRKEYTHENEELNALLGKKVQVKFFDGDVQMGVLERSKYHSGYYLIDNIEFRKSHVKKVLVL